MTNRNVPKAKTSAISASRALKEVGNQSVAAVNGATDAFTLGLGDRVQAFDMLKYGMGGQGNLIDRYKSNLDLLRARDQYEREHYGTARLVGGAAGTVGGLLMTGGAGAPAAAARLAPQTARVVGVGLPRLVALARPDTLAAGVGAATSVVGQGASDLASLKLSKPSDYASAALGGAVDGVLTFRAGPRAAAVANAATAAGAKSLMTGKPLSVEELERDMLGGVYLAKLGGISGERWSNALPNGIGKKRGDKYLTKGDFGDWISIQKSKLYGDDIKEKQKYEKVPGGHTRLDHVTTSGIPVEAKFGHDAGLSERQKEAVLFLKNYQVDHFTPRDIGNTFGGLLGAFGVQAPPEGPRQRR